MFAKTIFIFSTMPHFINLATIFGILFLFYSIGYGLNFFTKVAQKYDSPYYTIFSHVFLGLVFSVSMTACVFTGFKTIFILSFLLFGCIIFINKDKEANRRFYFKKLYTLPFFIILVYFLAVFRGYNTEGGYTSSLFLDYIFYKQVIINLMNGQENTSEWANILDADYNGVGVYHYFEFWLTILTKTFNSRPVLINFTVYVPTILVFVIFLGVVSILEARTKITTSYLFFAFALLFVGHAYLPIYERFFWAGHQHVFTSVGYVPIGTKLFPFALFSSAAFVFLSRERYSLFIICFLFLSIASFTSTPAVFGGFYFILIASLYFKFFENKTIFLLAFFPVLYFCFIFLFKQSTDGLIENMAQKSFTSSLPSFTSKEVIVYFFLRPSYFLLPVFILATGLFFRKKRAFKPIIQDKKIQFILLFLIGLSGSASFVALLYSHDTNNIQLIVLPLYGFSFSLLIFISKEINKKMYFSIVLLIFMISMNFYYNYTFFYQKINHPNLFSKEYSRVLEEELSSERLIPIAAFYSFQNPFNFVMFDDLGKEVAYLDNVGLIRMSNSTLSEEEQVNNFGVNIFYKFVKQNNYTLKNDLVKAQIHFFKKYTIRHLLIQKGQILPVEIENLVQKTYTDSVSGNRFCIIDLKEVE